MPTYYQQKRDMNMPETTTTKVPTMTRQHFAYIASVLADMPLLIDANAKDRIIWHFANELNATNARFDKDRFISACYDS